MLMFGWMPFGRLLSPTNLRSSGQLHPGGSRLGFRCYSSASVTYILHHTQMHTTSQALKWFRFWKYNECILLPLLGSGSGISPFLLQGEGQVAHTASLFEKHWSHTCCTSFFLHVTERQIATSRVRNRFSSSNKANNAQKFVKQITDFEVIQNRMLIPEKNLNRGPKTD